VGCTGGDDDNVHGRSVRAPLTCEEHQRIPRVRSSVFGWEVEPLFQEAARGARVRGRDLAREVDLRLDQVLEPLMLGVARDFEFDFDRLTTAF
jgi:hypothetical protein